MLVRTGPGSSGAGRQVEEGETFFSSPYLSGVTLLARRPTAGALAPSGISACHLAGKRLPLCVCVCVDWQEIELKQTK